jgi:hypothetical protein
MRLIPILVLLLLGCEKTDPECFTCTQTWIGEYRGSKSWQVCDVLEAAELNGKRETKWNYHTGGTRTGTTYITKCK